METEETKKAARTAIQKIAHTFGKEVNDIVYATVTSIDLTARTCVVQPITGQSDTEIQDVALSIDQNDGEIKVPAVNSTVGVIISTTMDAFVFAWSDLDSVVWKGGNKGGLVQVADLITKLNNLENAYNDLVTKFNAHTHILTLTSGTGTAAPTAAPETTVLTPSQRVDIENTKMKHGTV